VRHGELGANEHVTPVKEIQACSCSRSQVVLAEVSGRVLGSVSASNEPSLRIGKRQRSQAAGDVEVRKRTKRKE